MTFEWENPLWHSCIYLFKIKFYLKVCGSSKRPTITGLDVVQYEGLPGFRRKNMLLLLQSLEVIRIGLLFPLFSILYILAPHSRAGKTLRKPFITFICHSASYFTFLCKWNWSAWSYCVANICTVDSIIFRSFSSTDSGFAAHRNSFKYLVRSNSWWLRMDLRWCNYQTRSAAYFDWIVDSRLGFRFVFL